MSNVGQWTAGVFRFVVEVPNLCCSLSSVGLTITKLHFRLLLLLLLLGFRPFLPRFISSTMSVKFVLKAWQFMAASDEQPAAADGNSPTTIQAVPDSLDGFVLLITQNLNAQDATAALKELLANVPSDYVFPLHKVSLDLLAAVKNFDFRCTTILGSVGEGANMLLLWPEVPRNHPKFTRLNLVLWLENNCVLFNAFHSCGHSAPFIVNQLDGVQKKIEGKAFVTRIAQMERAEMQNPVANKGKVEHVIFTIAAATTDIICEMIMFAKTSSSTNVSLDHLKHRFGQLGTDLDAFANGGELPASLEKYGVLEQFYQA
jgi:hypothetical protein